MDRRTFLKSLGIGALSAAGCVTAASRSRASRDGRPNIVMILADDMGWSDLGCYGGETATPNLDRLAGNGIRFTQMHNTSKCFPSRACLITGLYAQQCGMHKGPGHIQRAVTFGEALRAAGYRTLMAGKHHGKDNPYDRGFDRYFGLRDGCCNFFNPGKQRPGEGLPAQKRREKRVWCIDGQVLQPYTPPEKDFYTTDYFTKAALSYLDEYQHEDKPFFLYLAYTAPHDPLQAWPEDIAKYEGKYDCGYEEIRRKRFARQKAMALVDESFPLSEPEHPDWESLKPEKRKTEARTMAVYSAMIDRMDQNIGKVLDKLEAQGKLDNTLVLFASDNGSSAEMVRLPGSGPIGSMTRWTSLGKNWANVSDTPFRKYKNFSHEGGICTPFIAHWPKGIQKPGRISHQPGHFIDVMPTLLAVAGASYPGKFNGEKILPMAGASLLPILQGADALPPRTLFWQWGRGRAVRHGQWKLVSQGKQWELYDMAGDKTETRNLAGEKPEMVKELSALYAKWKTSWPGT